MNGGWSPNLSGLAARRVGLVTHNGAGQGGEWQQRGQMAMAGLAETWQSLAEASAELSASEWALPTECPGWDVKDQLSHLIGVERAIMGEAAPDWDGSLGDHVRNDFAASNEPFVAVRRARAGPEVYAEFVDVTRTRLAQEEGRSDEEWAAVGWSPLGERPHAVFMEVRVFDSWVHEQDVRRALDRPGGSGNLASAMALTRVQDAMPFVVGKQAACPDGTDGPVRHRGRQRRRTHIYDRRRGGQGPTSRRHGGPDGGVVASEPRLHASRLRTDHGGTIGRAGHRGPD